MRRAVAALLLAATVAACSTPDTDETAAAEETQAGSTVEPTSEPETESVAPSVEETEVEIESETTSESEEAEGEGVRQIAFAEPFVHDGEVLVEVQKLRFMSREAIVREAGEDLESFLEDDTQTLVSLKVATVNNSDLAIDWYPNQDVIVLGDEQLDAAFFLSDDVAGDNWQPGVRKEGDIHWESRKNWEELVELGSLRLLVDAPFDSDAFEPVGDDIDLTVEWSP